MNDDTNLLLKLKISADIMDMILIVQSLMDTQLQLSAMLVEHTEQRPQDLDNLTKSLKVSMDGIKSKLSEMTARVAEFKGTPDGV